MLRIVWGAVALLFVVGAVGAATSLREDQRVTVPAVSTEPQQETVETYEDTGRLAGPELAAALGLQSFKLEGTSTHLSQCPTDVWTAKDDDGTAYCVEVDDVTTDPVEQWDIAMRLAGTVPTPEEIREYEADLAADGRGN